MPPSEAWQSDAAAYAVRCTSSLWGRPGKRALEFLKRMGLTEQTVRDARIGLCQRGLTFPWWNDGVLGALRIRCWEDGASGSLWVWRPGSAYGSALYGWNGVRAGRPVVVVDDELDVLSVIQETGVAAVAPGDTACVVSQAWTMRLHRASAILVAFERSSDVAAETWAESVGDSCRWRPYWGTPSDMLAWGSDLGAWIRAGTRNGADSPPTTITANEEGAPDGSTADYVARAEADEQWYAERFGPDMLEALGVWDAATRALVVWLWRSSLERDVWAPLNQGGTIVVGGEPWDAPRLAAFVGKIRAGPSGPDAATVRASLPHLREAAESAST